MRTEIDLNGLWEFAPQLDARGNVDPFADAGSRYGAQPGLNRRHWQRVPVPGVWQRYGERYDLYEGVAWFVRTFDAGCVRPGVRARLRFGAVNYRCIVHLNGREVGHHETGYTGFTVDVTDALQPGENHLAVLVDNRTHDMVWPPDPGYYNYGGIHRDVRLEILDGPCFEAVAAQGDRVGGVSRLRVFGRAVGLERGAVEVRVCGAVGSGAVDAAGAFAVEMEAPGAEPWSPDRPALHDVTAALMVDGAACDTVTTRTGFRRLEVCGGALAWNGEPFRVRGVCYVYDSPVHGLVMDAGQVEADLALMKAMGANAVRTHYPMSERFYAACDRVGLAVWIEPMVYCLHPADDAEGTLFGDPHARALAEQIVVEMIGEARSHPCVCIYGIGNECNARNPEAAAFFRDLAAVVRAQDGSRLVSFAALYGMVDTVAELVDVLGVNSYFGWYDRIDILGGCEAGAAASLADAVVPRDPGLSAALTGMLADVEARIPAHLAILLTEFGADSTPGFRSRTRDLWSEDYHAAVITEVCRVAAAHPRIAGTFPFCFTDYRDPSKPRNGFWNEQNLKGMVSYERRIKQPYHALRECYTGLAQPDGGTQEPGAKSATTGDGT